ncbi:MAG: type III secretion system stator protein SctL [Geminicoccaceae bacterium]
MIEQAESKDERTTGDKAIRYRPRGRVIPAQEISAWRTGQGYMEAAAKEAERLKGEARLAFEETKKNGFEEGRKAGAEAAARLLAETTLRADQYLAAADRQVVDLALAVVRRVLGEFDVGQLIQNAVRQALSSQRHSQHLTLHVAPDMVDGLRADIDARFDPTVRHLITVDPDHRQDQGQCRLASENGFVDLGIEAQLNAIHQGLADGLQRQTRA